MFQENLMPNKGKKSKRNYAFLVVKQQQQQQFDPEIPIEKKFCNFQQSSYFNINVPWASSKLRNRNKLEEDYFWAEHKLYFEWRKQYSPVFANPSQL